MSSQATDVAWPDLWTNSEYFSLDCPGGGASKNPHHIGRNADRIDGVLCKQVVCPGNDKIALEMNDVAEYLRALLNNVNLHRLYPCSGVDGPDEVTDGQSLESPKVTQGADVPRDVAHLEPVIINQQETSHPGACQFHNNGRAATAETYLETDD